MLFSCSKGVDLGCFFEKTAARYFACRTTFSVLTASKERCKRLHLQISCGADIDGDCTHRVQFCNANDCANNQNRRRRRLPSLLLQFRRLSACYPSGDVLFYTLLFLSEFAGFCWVLLCFITKSITTNKKKAPHITWTVSF